MEIITYVQMNLDIYKIPPDNKLPTSYIHISNYDIDPKIISDIKSSSKRNLLNIIKTDSHLVNYNLNIEAN